MKKTRDYQETLIKGLKDPLEAAEYLNAAIEQGDREMFLIALRNVAEASGGLSRLSRNTRLNRSNLHRLLSKHGNPEVQTLAEILHAFGLRLAVFVEKTRPLSKAA
jgi:probable addiction module antidote protein